MAEVGGRVPESERLEEGCLKVRGWRKDAGKRQVGGRVPESERLEEGCWKARLGVCH